MTDRQPASAPETERRQSRAAQRSRIALISTPGLIAVVLLATAIVLMILPRPPTASTTVAESKRPAR